MAKAPASLGAFAFCMNFALKRIIREDSGGIFRQEAVDAVVLLVGETEVQRR